ncbi:D-2-hydroxyacid dehydrogenase [Dactylosporangium sp. AC04546]|uniref:D-2-hydroxyacid dehydrogenase n=1 Tax=Dactylosporangium sp. AC04546 TaxID=2862460 RepID=UPI001EDF955B|nr:D-2-hydroxyacid dehydrogenase [Dactylosporangium sp. AC04546]WVK78628.1 D-2-hydroxyacid dehydrogenase [Dactylosporangium sp. AC04546]
MTGPHVLLTPNLAELVPGLRADYPHCRFTPIPDDEPVRDEWLDAEVILRSAMNEDTFEELLSKCDRLRWVQITAAGFDWVGGEVWRRRLDEGLIYTRSPNSYNVPIAEYVIGAVLMHGRAFPALREAQQRHEWIRLVGKDVIGSTMLVFGTGGIGSEVAWRASALGATVIGVNRTGSPVDGFTRVLAFGEHLALLPEADAVVLAMPLTSENRYFFGAEHFAAMRPSAVLVNVGRGALVVEDALVEAMHAGRIGGAVLDVFEEEPLPAEHRLWDLPNTTITPHTSFRGSGNLQRLGADFRANLDRFLAGAPLAGTKRQPELGY